MKIGKQEPDGIRSLSIVHGHHIPKKKVGQAEGRIRAKKETQRKLERENIALEEIQVFVLVLIQISIVDY